MKAVLLYFCRIPRIGHRCILRNGKVTDLMGSLGFNTAFKKEMRMFGCFSFPKIFLNTKSILGGNRANVI